MSLFLSNICIFIFNTELLAEWNKKDFQSEKSLPEATGKSVLIRGNTLTEQLKMLSKIMVLLIYLYQYINATISLTAPKLVLHGSTKLMYFTQF